MSYLYSMTANLFQGEGPIIKGQGLLINMSFERSVDQDGNLQSLADMLHAEGLEPGPMKDWREGEDSEEGWYQVPYLDLAGLTQNINRLGKEKPAGPRRSKRDRPEKGWYSKVFNSWQAGPEQSERVHPWSPSAMQGVNSLVAGPWRGPGGSGGGLRWPGCLARGGYLGH